MRALDPGWHQLPLQLQRERPDAVRSSRLAQEMQEVQQGRDHFYDCPRLLQALNDKALRIAQAIFSKGL
jgi:hypothetical protein